MFCERAAKTDARTNNKIPNASGPRRPNRCLVAQQIQYAVGDIGRFTNTPKRHCFPAGFSNVRILQVSCERRFDRARSNRVNANPGLRPFKRHLLGQEGDTCFDCAVRTRSAVRMLAADRRNVHYRAGLIFPNQTPRENLGHQECPRKSDIQRLTASSFGELNQGCRVH